MQEKWEELWPYKSLYMNIHNGIIHNRQKVEMAQIYFKW